MSHLDEEKQVLIARIKRIRDALRGLGMVDCNGKRRRAFHGEETAPAGTSAQWRASICALFPPAYIPNAVGGSGLRCLDPGAGLRDTLRLQCPLDMFTQVKMR